MATNLSPAVNVREIDLTTTVTGTNTSSCVFAGEFIWGPVNDITQISNEQTLVARFGIPTNNTFASFYSAKNFLDYSTNLKVVRVSTADQLNAVSSGTAIKIGNASVYDASYSNGEANVGMFAAKYPGTIGNSLKVSVCDASTFIKSLTGTVEVSSSSATVTGTNTAFTTETAVGSYISVTVGGTTVTRQITAIGSDVSITLDGVVGVTGTGLTVTAKWEYYQYFAGAPVDSNKAVSMGASNDGMHAVIIDEDGLFTGVPNTVLQSFDNISKASNAVKFDGTSGYYKTVLNSSNYIWWLDHPDSSDLTTTGTDVGGAVVAATSFKNFKKPITRSLVGGADGDAASDGEITSAYDLFRDVENVDVNLIISGKASVYVSKYILTNIADVRSDCVAFVSPCKPDGTPIIGDTSESLELIIEWYDSVNVSSSYGFADTGYKYQYDKYNDVYRWIPLNADMAGLCARTDYTAETWYSPAGINRGQIKNVTRLAFNPDKPARDELFKRNINPVVSFSGDGTVLFGDKTMLRRPSAFDAINVRRLFIYIERTVARSAKLFLFEQNTELTRQLFAGLITPLLRDIKGRQGIIDFYVDVGSSVNTPETIDAGELRANIFIKPVRSIRFINLSFIATRTSANFVEIEL